MNLDGFKILHVRRWSIALQGFPSRTHTPSDVFVGGVVAYNRTNIEDIRGKVFRGVTVINECEKNDKGRRQVLVRCDACGAEVKREIYRVLRGELGSCGCIRGKRGGRSHHPLYRTWYGIRERTNVESCDAWKHYGGRGISMCGEWDDFEVFFHWAIKSGWKPGLEIDRIDNDGNYEPTNCRFVTHKVNMQNTSRNVLNRDRAFLCRRMNQLGYSFRQIAEVMGVSVESARNAAMGKTYV